MPFETDVLTGRPFRIFGAAFLVVTLTQLASARSSDPKIDLLTKETLPSQTSTSVPVVKYTAHNRGTIQLAIANNGTFGTLGGTIPDPFTGRPIPSCIYPAGSDVVFLWVAAVWIGAVVSRDTLVSCANEDFYRTTEFWPDVEPFGNFRYASLDRSSHFYDPKAHSEQDILCEYTDTVVGSGLVASDPTDARPHVPLNVKVTQRSMAWSYSYADDFILFDYQVQNIGARELQDVYIGIYVDGDVWHTTRQGPEGWNDDIVGFYRTHPAPEGHGYIDTINIAYHADNNGDPEGGQWNDRSARSAVGVRVVRTPSTSLKYSFNWWVTNYSDVTRDFGPRRQGRLGDPYRYFGSRMGTPEGDRNKYYILSHEEFDYDLLFTAINHGSEGWLQPPTDADLLANGWDTRYLLSFGPFDIASGQKLPVSFAWVGGLDLHVRPTDFEDLFNPYEPEVYYQSLDFSKLAANSRWASWVYDNPGIDTDGDGYSGPVRKIVDSVTGAIDSFYSAGDGVPDFRGAGPPPAPRIRVTTEPGKLLVRWNGFYSETTRDIFSKIVDFEGYRIYIARDDRPSSYSVIASYDREDFNRYRLKRTTGGEREWLLEETPFSLDSLRRLYGDPQFDPLRYTPESPFTFSGAIYFFQPQDFNMSVLGPASGIHRAYPDASDPGADPTLWRPEDITDEHGEPLPKYYEYEYVIDSLLPTVQYFAAVTSFDFGSPIAELPALET
ncbi:MAG TPA: hypothetical protein VN285_07225, partial [Candidatus Deferrimicrobium sp.]|nr:hypothetical protein [Candidatus Deferrimicrobium sp.]